MHGRCKVSPDGRREGGECIILTKNVFKFLKRLHEFSRDGHIDSNQMVNKFLAASRVYSRMGKCENKEYALVRSENGIIFGS